MKTHTYLFVATEAGMSDALFGAHLAAEALVAEQDGVVVAYALFFQNFSIFLGKRGLFWKTSTCARRCAAVTSARRC